MRIKPNGGEIEDGDKKRNQVTPLMQMSHLIITVIRRYARTRTRTYTQTFSAPRFPFDLMHFITAVCVLVCVYVCVCSCGRKNIWALNDSLIGMVKYTHARTMTWCSDHTTAAG